METDYGRIRMQTDFENSTVTRYPICILCNYHILTKGGIKVHLSRKHNELLKRYDLQFPFCPKTRKDPGSINRHLYKNNNVHIIENIQTINWLDVWKQICLVNNPTDFNSLTNPRNTLTENEPSSTSNNIP